MAPGLLISFDGLDSSGKATQSKLLYEHLASQGALARYVTSPDYTTASGKELKLRLQSKLGNWDKTTWQEKMKYFADNRAEHREEVVNTVSEGGIVVYDRYVPSSMAFMAEESRAIGEERTKVQEAVAAYEYETNNMPHEDASLFFDIPPRVAMDLLEGRKHDRGDEAEYTDYIQVQEALYAEYLSMIDEKPGHMLHIQCMDGERLRTIAEVSQIVRTQLAQRFPDRAQLFA
ncbi:MAG: hypothetical protein A3C02_00910 [Candidatus Andersenbacteria bacterium RIFCSPHIGHO2_02_FULL_45_11]|uniref:Thymidylate kinase n=1 Tax=Candidatus Andersenbacteria bacterium RIFCSPHIGHO2_12_FULL_45_11 TaxID=1797281 RepID=A0A1G1X5V4_9BACT|nr:MAG: hypothetical protein A2805_01515 [Candidatus Andersenbacteria bacterium RIFCSPHIGHO2_01_FULL_46_36]OGY33343.1 MAG: hypothetical protein A3C02_00910 [Candidatus Andersenbacteria bacterium RIFCSPHIGHO2_02_FULL_45_11]OGY34697.1 MAG: hypothetical protein A3D99_05160 [Candidatus Andersenbacteria bacterium RIFCSPHIGHO2_12_FULL_45_11]